MKPVTINALVDEKWRKYAFILDFLADSRSTDRNEAVTDYDILLASGVLPVITEGMENLCIEVCYHF